MMKRAMPRPMARPAPMQRQPMNRAAPMAYMADGGLVGSAARTCGCVGPSGGTGGTRGHQDYRK
jgi:hypothetical protein